jgi:hypothetical protein
MITESQYRSRIEHFPRQLRELALSDPLIQSAINMYANSELQYGYVLE